MEGSKSQLLDQTKWFWQARTGKPISDEDAREIIENMTRFFKILMEWDEKAKGRSKSSGEWGAPIKTY